MAEPKWTVNGRATPTTGEPASEPATATATAGEAVAAQPAKQPTPMTPLDALLTDPSFFTAEEDAEIQRTMAAHKVDRLHPVIQNSVEQLLYRRQYREDWRKYQEAQTKMVARIEDVQEKTLARVEELVTRIEAMSPDVKSARKSGPPLVVQPAASAAIYACITGVVGVIAWLAGQGIGATQSAAQLRAAAPQVATLLTTRPGQAALGLVRDNGDALPKILSQCHTFLDHGRDAMSCTLWARGTGVPLTTPTVLDNALAVIAAIPAWPVVLLMVVGAAVWFARRSGRNAAARASRAW
jgi:hypothetical protein